MSTPVLKHPCPDCHHCQWCGDDRCRLCRRSPAGAARKLSLAEQIAQYEQLNCTCGQPAAAGHGPEPSPTGSSAP